jgi:hypothetical protein
MSGGLISRELYDQIARVIRETIRRERNPRQTRNRWHKKGSGATNAIIGHGVIVEAVCEDWYVKVDPDAATTWVNGCQTLPDQDYEGEILIYDPCPDTNGKMAGYTEAELLGAVVQFYRACNPYTNESKYFIIDICINVTCDEVA